MLTKIRDFFKKEYGWDKSISVGRIDKDCDKAVCFYNSKHGSPKKTALGGKINKSYRLLPITILLRWTNSPVEAEAKAQELFEFFDEKTFYINEQRVFVISRYDFPIDLGSDENGVCECSLELDFYFNKE